MLHRLATRIEIKAVDTSQRLIDGFAAAIGNKDRVGDIIDQGAFDRTLKENPDVLVFVGHDATRLPVGEPVSMRTEAKGLFTQTRVYETAAGDELLEVAKQRMASGKTLGMSIGYRTVKDRYSGGARHLIDLDLVEYSFLASPALAANPLATTVGVKAVSLLDESFEDMIRDLGEAASEKLGQGCCVCATYPDHVIVLAWGSQEEQYWDFPYTVGDDGEPVLGEPKPVQPAYVPGAAKARAEAQRQEDQRMDSKATWTAAYINDLPDSSFAYIESGGVKDDSGRTTPRSLRHFPHHNADGALDLGHVRNELKSAPLSGATAAAVAHLERHADSHEDAHGSQWAEGVAPTLLSAASTLKHLAEDAAADRQAMERLGVDTKKGARLNAQMRKKLKDLHGTLGQILDWAEAIEQGEDGKARVDSYRHRLALMELEEVA